MTSRLPTEARSPRGWLRGLQRVTTSGVYLPEVDGLRFVAITAVVLFHITLTTCLRFGTCAVLDAGVPRLLNQANRGVELFFVVSGLVLGLPFANEHVLDGNPVHLKRYFLRRVTRLEPPYVLNLLMRFPLLLLARDVPFRTALPHLLASLFYVHGVVYGTQPLIHVPSWSLEVEVQFYLLAPFFALAFLRWRPVPRRVLLGVTIIAFSVLRLYTPGEHQTRVHLSLISFLQYFLLGFLLADWLVSARSPRKNAWEWDLVSLGCGAAVFAVPERPSFLLLPLLLGGVFLGVFEGRYVRRLLSAPVIFTIGGMCYSLYLTHGLVLQTWVWFLGRSAAVPGTFWHTFAFGLGAVIPILLVGTLYFKLVERPCMDPAWPGKLLAFWRGRGDRASPPNGNG